MIKDWQLTNSNMNYSSGKPQTSEHRSNDNEILGVGLCYARRCDRIKLSPPNIQISSGKTEINQKNIYRVVLTKQHTHFHRNNNNMNIVM
jgi:hypothetical protein